MKLISWNLNHRTREKAIPPEVLRFFDRWSPDLIVLNEYVECAERLDFRRQLAENGWRHQLLSEARGKNNRIFVAARTPLTSGSMSPPDLTEAAVSNFLHLYLPQIDLDLIAMRAPCYTSVAEKAAYWRQLGGRLANAPRRRQIMLGDFNYDPFAGLAQSAASITVELGGGYRLVNPEGGWSYISCDGKRRSRIDHVLVSEALELRSVHYLSAYGDIQLAGPQSACAISDHAVLAVELVAPEFSADRDDGAF